MGDTAEAVIERRPVYFDEWCEATIYDRAKLGAGHRITGPCVAQEFGSTVPIHPGFVATVDEFANIVVTKEAE